VALLRRGSHVRTDPTARNMDDDHHTVGVIDLAEAPAAHLASAAFFLAVATLGEVIAQHECASRARDRPGRREVYSWSCAPLQSNGAWSRFGGTHSGCLSVPGDHGAELVAATSISPGATINC
jgi:hypothetical protein